jgi:dipeptidyl aminopeptidase/acylaminoacyl peptidase
MRLRFSLSCFALLAAAPLASLAAPKVPLSAFVGQEQYSRPRLAPDGKHIAITVQMPSGGRTVPVVMTYTVPELKISGAVRLPAFEVPLDYHWVSNERLVIRRGIELGSREKPVSTGELLATDLDGKKQEYLFGYRMFAMSSRGDRYGDDIAYSDIEHIARERNNHLLVSAQPWKVRQTMLYDIDARTATRKLVADLAMSNLGFVMQNNGKPRFAYGTGDDSYAVLFRYNDASGAWEQQKEHDRLYAPQSFSRDDRQFAALLSAKGEPESLVREDLATGTRTTLFDDHVAAPASLLYGVRGDLPFGVRPGTGAARAVYFDDANEDARLHKLLSQQFPGSWVGFDNYSDDGRLLLFHVVSDRDPGSYYLFDKSSGKADMLFSAMEAIDPDQMAERRPISFKARDGLALHGYLTVPSHPAGSRLPLVLIPHGGPHGISDTWFFDSDAQFLASRGYAVLQVNFRGSDGRGPDFESAGHHEWGGKVQDDLVDAVRWTIGEGLADPQRICAYGASFGGYSALMLAAREPGLFKCAVGYAGVYDLNLMRESDEARADVRFTSYLKRVIGTDKAELDRF